MAAKVSPREAALADVETHRGVVARWEAEKAAAEAELADLQARAGEEVLADESAAGRLSKAMGELRDRIDIASRAVKAATPKLDSACQAAVLAEADEWDAQRAVRQARLDEFDAQTQKLLNALQEFTGRVWHQRTADCQGGSSSSVTVAGYDLAKAAPVGRVGRAPLLEAVRIAERTAWCLREIADGRDPHKALSEPLEGPMLRGLVSGPSPRDFYTDSVWGPDAVMPAPAYLRAVAAGTADQEPVEHAEVPGTPPGDGVAVSQAKQ